MASVKFRFQFKFQVGIRLQVSIRFVVNFRSMFGFLVVLDLCLGGSIGKELVFSFTLGYG